jgi:V8-like Glu-specific endopeptidase
MTDHSGSTGTWPVDLTRSVAQVLKSSGSPAGTSFLVGERLLATCMHVLTAEADGEPPTGPVTVVFRHLDGVARTAWAAIYERSAAGGCPTGPAVPTAR